MDSLRSQSAAGLPSAHLRPKWPGSAAPEGQDPGGDQTPQRDTFYTSEPAGDELDEEEEEAEGHRQQDELLGRYPPWSCPASARLLEDMLDTLRPHSRRPEVSYQFLALDTQTPFASSCCHGAVYFSRALLSGVTEPGILFFAAHEMAHTELRHYASRRRRLACLRRAIPAAPGSLARQRMELAAVLAVRHQEEFEADHLAARWLGHRQGQRAVQELHELCLRCCPESLTRPTHPPFEQRVQRLAGGWEPPDPLDYLWSLLG